MCLVWRVVREGGRGRGERGEVCVSCGDWLGREVEGGERWWRYGGWRVVREVDSGRGGRLELWRMEIG